MSENGLRDPWIDLIRGGSIPADGDALMDATNLNGPNYEIVDKILPIEEVRHCPLMHRAIGSENQTFVDPSGKHSPIIIRLQRIVYSTSLVPTKFNNGGSEGTGFNDLNQIPDARPSSVALNSGNRIDGISMLYRDGTNLAHGGNRTVPR